MKRFVLIRGFRPFSFFCVLALFSCAVIAAIVVYHGEETASVKSGQPLRGKIIAVDAGHGGADPGAVGVTGTVEKEINLILAQKLKKQLEAKGAVVVMTRTADRVFSDIKKEELEHRAELVKKGKAELFLSLQCNAVPNSELRGAQTFYHPDSEQGKKLAEAIQERFKTKLKNTDREALTLDSAYIMKLLDIPAVMVEVGFLSNPGEEARLKDDAYREKLIAAVYGGICDYYTKKDSSPSWLPAIFHFDDTL